MILRRNPIPAFQVRLASALANDSVHFCRLSMVTIAVHQRILQPDAQQATIAPVERKQSRAET